MPLLNLYSELAPFEDVGGDMVARLRDLSLNTVFEPAIECYKDRPDLFNKVLFYILHVYSKETKMVINGVSPVLEKQRIADHVGLEDEKDIPVRSDCIYLQTPAILFTVQRYLRFQMSKPLEHLTMKRELYQQMLLSAIDDIKDGNDVVMYDQKFKNSGYADKLYDEIHEWEQKLMSEFKELKEAIEELRQQNKLKNKDSMRIEDMLREGDDGPA